MTQTTKQADAADLAPIEDRLVDFDGFLERLAAEYGMATLDVVNRLPAEHLVIVSGDKLPAVLEDVSKWGPILFIVETDEIVTGMTAELPAAYQADGYFLFLSPKGFGGHLKEDACVHIGFIHRPFQKRQSRSLHFYNASGEPIFKLFVARSGDGDMDPGQVQAFEDLQARLS